MICPKALGTSVSEMSSSSILIHSVETIWKYIYSLFSSPRHLVSYEKPPTLESLPNELLVLLLQHVSSPSDLVTLTKASPQCYRIFKSSEGLVLSSVVRNTLLPEILPLAITACEASTIAEFASAPPFSYRSHDDVYLEDLWYLIDHFCDEREGRLSSCDLSPQNGALWSRMFRLCVVVEFFVLRFAQHALGRMQLLVADPTGDLDGATLDASSTSSIELSTTERARLQRAFLRFEIHRKLFCTGLFDCVLGVESSEDRRKARTLDSLSPWEREEFSCVYLYLIEVVTGLVHNMEDHIVAKIQSLSRRADCVEAEKSAEEMAKPQWNRRDAAGDLLFACLSSLSNPSKRYQLENVERIVGHGLPFLRMFFQNDIFGQLRLYQAFSNHSCQSSFQRDLVAMPYYDGEVKDSSLESCCDDLKSANAGWLWSTQFSESSQPRLMRHRSGMGQLGYMFWDKPRLENLKLFNMSKPLSPSGPTDGSSHLQSVDQRCRGLYVTKEAMAELRPPLLWDKIKPSLLAALEY